MFQRALPGLLAGLLLAGCTANVTANTSANPSAKPSTSPSTSPSASPSAGPSLPAAGKYGLVTLLVDGAPVTLDPMAADQTTTPSEPSFAYGKQGYSDDRKNGEWGANINLSYQRGTNQPYVYSLAFQVQTSPKGGDIFLSSGSLPSSEITTTLTGDKLDFTFKGKVASMSNSGVSHDFNLTVKGMPTPKPAK